MRRRGFPFSEKLLRAGRATLLHQHSSRSPQPSFRGCFRPSSSVGCAAFFLSYSGSGEVIHRLARCQRTPIRSRVVRIVSPETRFLVSPSSKLTSAAISKVHKLLCLSKLLGLL